MNAPIETLEEKQQRLKVEIGKAETTLDGEWVRLRKIYESSWEQGVPPPPCEDSARAAFKDLRRLKLRLADMILEGK